LHWNGTRWKHVPSPSPSPFSELFGVAATSSRHAWAVGYSYGTTEQNLALRCGP
jgi:hypothetical protein